MLVSRQSAYTGVIHDSLVSQTPNYNGSMTADVANIVMLQYSLCKMTVEAADETILVYCYFRCVSSAAGDERSGVHSL